MAGVDGVFKVRPKVFSRSEPDATEGGCLSECIPPSKITVSLHPTSARARSSPMERGHNWSEPEVESIGSEKVLPGKGICCW